MNAKPAYRSRSDWERLAAPLRPEGRAVINGERVGARSGRVFEKRTPIDGRVIAQVARCEQADVDAAVASSRAAFEDGRWRRSRAEGAQARAAAFRRTHPRRSRPPRHARDARRRQADPDRSRSMCRRRARASPTTPRLDKLYDEIAPTGPSDLALIRREPVGVVAAMVPWNFPLHRDLLEDRSGAAIGNSVVLKPAEQSPLTAIRLGELAAEAGMPPGCSMWYPDWGGPRARPLARHLDVDLVAFTGPPRSASSCCAMRASESEARLARVRRQDAARGARGS